MGAYANALPQVRLSGPTLFAPIIGNAIQASMVPVDQTYQYYNILLMITDGEINDMPQTVSALVDASKFPLSVIIIGVGNADFHSMNVLDSDGAVLQDQSGRRAVRDIVQFVPFNDFKGKHYAELAKHTLAEIPGQILGFMRSRNIIPNPRIPLSAAPPMEEGGANIQVPPVQGYSAPLRP